MMSDLGLSRGGGNSQGWRRPKSTITGPYQKLVHIQSHTGQFKLLCGALFAGNEYMYKPRPLVQALHPTKYKQYDAGNLTPQELESVTCTECLAYYKRHQRN